MKLRLFERDECTIYINLTSYLQVSPRGFYDSRSINAFDVKLSNYAIYYRSPYFRLGNPSNSLESDNDILCKQDEIGEKYVVEVMDFSSGPDCDGFGLVTVML